MDIARLFDSFGNFGQDDLTSKNPNGTADIIIENANMTFDENYQTGIPSYMYLLRWPSTMVNSLTTNPWKELSGYIDVDELETHQIQSDGKPDERSTKRSSPSLAMGGQLFGPQPGGHRHPICSIIISTTSSRSAR